MKRALLISVTLLTLGIASPALAQTKPPPLQQTNQAALRGPADASAVGALLEFGYERGALYAIQASPQRITDIALEQGETLLSVSAGDTVTLATTATSTEAGRAAMRMPSTFSKMVADRVRSMRLPAMSMK